MYRPLLRRLFQPRRILLTLVTAVAVSGALASLDWLITVRELDAGFHTWAAQHRIAGWRIVAGRTERGGWPFAATLTIPDLALTATLPGPKIDLTWNADRLVLRVNLVQPGTLHLLAEGAQRLQLWDGPTISFTAERLRSSIPLGFDATDGDFAIEASNLRATIPPEQEAVGTLTIGELRAHAGLTAASPPEGGTLTFSVTAAAIGLPPQIRWPLGSTIAAFAIEGSIDGPLPQVDGLTATAAAWRDGGGSIEIQRLALGWGPLNMTGAATLALDEQLQPMGTGSGKLTGYSAALDALSSNGMLSRSAVIAAKAVLSLLADAPAPNEETEVEVPVTLQFRTLSMRQIPLVRLPELDWPER